MAEPPSYEESASQYGDSSTAGQSHPKNGDSKLSQHFSIRDEVGTSRSQHVATLVSKLLPQIRERAQQGLSKSTLLLLPSDQADLSKNGELVGFPQDDPPVLIQLEGRYDGTQFWTQQEALDSLKQQMLHALIGEQPVKAALTEILPDRRPAPSKKVSFFGRKASKAPEPRVEAAPVTPPVSVQVDLDQANFRSETEYGLFKTLTGRAVLIVIDVK